MDFSTSTKSLPKVGQKLSAALKLLEIDTVGDLLYHFPYKYLDFSNGTVIEELKVGQTVTITARIDTIKAQRSFKSRLSFTVAKVVDDTGALEVVWFNQPYLAKSYKSEDEVYLAGTVTQKTNGKVQLVNPIIERIKNDSLHTGRIVPVYHSVELVYNKTLRNLVDFCLKNIQAWPEVLPSSILEKYNLIDIQTAITELHFPTEWEEIEKAKLRIACDELLPQQIAVLLKQQQLEKVGGFAMPTKLKEIQEFINSLPFTLTNSQKRAAWDILQDLELKKPMNRMLQGEVGSGKTAVIAVAAVQAALSGNQTAIVAPTEILAKQHFDTFRKILSKDPKISVALLTKSMVWLDGEKLTKAKLQQAFKNHKADIIIGTHALLQEGNVFNKLGLIVIDEQHRFGVAQRSYLKQNYTNQPPHLLSVSATPIPRTLALSIYGHLAISDLKQLPSGRKPIITKIVRETDRDKVYQFITEQVNLGRQAFIVTPRVEDSEKSQLKAAKVEYEKLKKLVFPKLKIGLIYGKMPGVTKDKTTKQFAEREIDILVATSVIEIGIDFPNASVMVIEGAERFGLAQLHQLRGRVGRGLSQSYCFLLTTDDNAEDNSRLQIFTKSYDGFKLAEEDLKQRGFGDLFGSTQSGFNFRFPKFITEKALYLSKDIAEEFVNNSGVKPVGFEVLLTEAQQYIESYHGE